MSHPLFRITLVALLVAGGFGAVVVRLWGIQVERSDEFKAKVPGTSEVTVRIPGVRGLIRDRRGRVLVDNVARYEMQFQLNDILEDFKVRLAAANKEIALANRSLPEGQRLEPRELPTRVFKGQPEADLVAIISETVLPQLNELGLFVEFNAENLQRHYRSGSGLIPFTYRDDLSFEEYAIAAEHSLDLPGVSVQARPLRRYIYGAMAAHVLGYVNQPDIDKVPAEERNAWDYYVPDDYGAEGIEMTQDSILRGRAGRRVLLRDEKGRIVSNKDESGRIVGEITYEPPQPGADVWLSIDRDYQLIVEAALQESGIGRGSAVVVSPTTYKREVGKGDKKEAHWVYAGDVLAMASVPNYDPNRFIPSISREEYDSYLGNKADPFINRSLKDHAPGSTFKPVVGLAGHLTGAASRAYPCEGGAGYGNAYFKCWCNGKGYTHGTIRMREGMMHSCNGYFYRLGNAAGIRAIDDVAALLGLGEGSGIPLLDEDTGVIPSPEFKLSLGQGRWGAADTAQVSIGQHQVEATPLQMAMVSATLANGGLSYKPRLVHRVVENGVERREGTEPVLRTDLTEHGITKEQIEELRGGMWDVVNKAGGTARRARSEITQISGKTGTSQTGRLLEDGSNETNAWFIAFAPYDKPRLAVCVFAERGKAGGVVGAPVAKRIIDEILSVDEHGYLPPTEAVAEFEGHFDFLELVSFGSSPTDAFVGDDEADVGSVAAAPTPAPRNPETVRKARPAAPTVRAEPDQRGSAPVRKVRRGILDRRWGGRR